MVSYPVVLTNKEDVKFSYLRDTILIYYLNDIVVYGLLPIRKFETDEKISNSRPYFIFRKNNQYGRLLRSLNDTSCGSRLPVDSLLTKRGFAGSRLEFSSEDTLLETEIDKENNFVLEKIIPKKYDENSFDSIYYYYSSNLRGIDYSLSNKLDSVKHMKLCEVRLLYNGGFSKTYNMTLPKREFQFKIEEAAITNSKEILNLFKRLEKCSLKE